MSLTFTGKKRIRKSFGRIPEVVRMPNLIEVQKSSYNKFLQVDIPHEDRGDNGLNGVFTSVFPVRDFSDRAVLEYVSLTLINRNLTKRNANSATLHSQHL